MKVLSLFSGIGAPEQALKNIGVKYVLVGFSEIDKFAIKSYCAIQDEDEEKNLGDVTKINEKELPKDIDLIVHGSPCTDFSVAGLEKGGDEGSGTRSSLLWNSVRIIKECKPKYVLWENVKGVLSKKHIHNFKKYLNEMEQNGYNNFYKVLNALDYGIPQNRERIFVLSIKRNLKQGFEFPEPPFKQAKLESILEENVEEKYYINNERAKEVIKGFEGELAIGDPIRSRDFKVKGWKKRSPTLQARDYKDPKNIIFPYQGSYIIRKLTPKEYWRMMGFKDEQFMKAKNVCSNSQLYKQAGNSIVIPVLEDIFKTLLK